MTETHTADWIRAQRTNTETRELVVRRLDTFERRPVRWLWERRLPLGKLTMLDGEGGRGKSTLLADLAARVTTGRTMPDGSPGLDGDVVLISLEDDPEDTILPRIEDAGGDPSRVHLVEAVLVNDAECGLSLPADLEALEKLIAEVNAKLVIIDPLMAALSTSINSNSDQESRTALTPLKRVAQRTGAAIVLVRHFTKAPGATAAARGGGSVAFMAAARSGLIVAEDPEEPGVMVLAVAKSNLAERAPSLRYKITTSPGGVSKIKWMGVSEKTADELVMAPGPKPTARVDAEAFLEELLADGPMLATEVEEAAEAAGIKYRTLHRAKGELKVESRRRFDQGRRWEWSLPDTLPPSLSTTSAGDLGDLGNVRRVDRQDCQDRHQIKVEEDVASFFAPPRDPVL